MTAPAPRTIQDHIAYLYELIRNMRNESAGVTSEIRTTETIDDDLSLYQLRSEKSAADGYASLDSGLLVPVAELGTGSADSTKFLRGDQTWAVPSGTGAPSDADYLVGTANGGLSAEIVVGTAPGGELGGTWGSPTVDATHSGSAHHAQLHAADHAPGQPDSIDGTYATDTALAAHLATENADHGMEHSDLLLADHVIVIGPWVYENLPASVTNQNITFGGSTSPNVAMPYAGELRGISVRGESPRTAGTATFKSRIDNVDTGLNAVIDGTNTQTSYATQAAGLDAFTAGQVLRVVVTTDSGWLPITSDWLILLFVTFAGI